MKARFPGKKVFVTLFSKMCISWGHLNYVSLADDDPFDKTIKPDRVM